MSQTPYQRTVAELRKHASFFWPAEISEKASELSILPTLLETQDQFIAILSVEVKDIDSMFTVISSSTALSANLFLKHLMVLSDVGGESIQRYNSEFGMLFPDGTLEYIWNGSTQTYQFKELPLKGLNNDKLGVSDKTLLQPRNLTPLYQDVIALLLVGGASTSEETAETLQKCEISDYIGKPKELQEFINQRYIWVSRITGGAKANTLGQLAQQFVHDYLAESLSTPDINIRMNGHLPGVTHTAEGNERLTTFDLVVTNGTQYVAIEVSFQVTTNSTIERKAGQARSRFRQIEEKGYHIAYVLDGAGNFQRQSALSTMCEHSHCTVAFSRSELEVLCQFIREHMQIE